MNLIGHWEGNWFHWLCPGCSAALTALQAPSDEDSRCRGCRTEEQCQDAMQRLVEWLEKERLDWRAKCWAAERERDAALRELAAMKGTAA